MDNKLKIYNADIHMHTPASKCYKGNKEDDEYFKIIKTSKSEKLDIIAISDHNSIEGYALLIEKKNQLINEISVLNRLNDSEQAKNRLAQLNLKLQLFDDILILPAVEFEVNNGIHLLVIFNPETPISDINLFLKDGGYDPESYGYEKSDTISNWSIFDLYDKIKDYDCIIIDGHTDSDKGIYNTIPKGASRAHAFKNKSLSGVCYKNEKQRNLLESTLKNSKEYQRDTPLAFIKASDAHNLDEIGKVRTFFKLENLNWEAFKDSFNNSAEYIFTNYPETQSIINRIIENEITILIENIENKNIDLFGQSICALNNSEGGYILLGVDSNKIISGLLSKTTDEENKYIDFIYNGIKRVKKNVKFGINTYEVRDNKVIFVIKITKGELLIDLDRNGIIYSYKKNEIIRLSASQIQKRIEDDTIEKIESKIEKSLIEINKQTEIVKTNLKSIPIINNFIENSISFRQMIEFELIKSFKLDSESQKKLIDYSVYNGNGKSRGNIFFFKNKQQPRLKDAFLRISIPKFNTNPLNFSSTNTESSYIIPGGAIFYSKKTIPHYNPKENFIIQFQVKKDSKYSLKFITAFLKSSFFLWFLIIKHDSLDLHNSKIFKSINLPVINFKNPKKVELIKDIEKEFNEIIIQEREFVQIRLNEDNYEREIKNHNSKIDRSALNIDNHIYEILDLDTETISLIKESLKANQIYLP